MTECRTILLRIETLLSLLSTHLNINDENNKSKEEIFGDILMNESESIAKRMRTCFELKSLNTESAIDALNRGLLMSTSALLKHEIAYVLGQMRNKYAVKYLINVLENEAEEVIVRHECCEALGAIADTQTMDIIRKYCNHKSIEIAETAQLALECIQMAQNDNKIPKSKYNSVDPAPPFSDITDLDKLKTIYLSETECLFKRYRAMFTLRDIESDEAANVLSMGLNDKSALFRHEIAFVLGQMMNDNAVNALSKVLRNKSENEIVRHEAAGALGAIANKECKEVIGQHLNDEYLVVKESCIVANDVYEFWTTPEL